MHHRFSALLIPILLGATVVAAAPLDPVSPEQVGVSSARLERLHAYHQAQVDQGRVAGVITLMARRGKLVDLTAYGYQDLEQKTPMRTDTIVRFYSMSKTITSVAVMMLVEEGKIALGDPIGNYLPELADLKVCVGGTPDEPELVDAVRPVTVKHLLTHTSGMTYGSPDEGASVVSRLYARPQNDPFQVESLAEMVTRMGALPLLHQPGEGWTYGVSIDVLGRLIEVASGSSFEEFLAERIFAPLGMVDTFFEVPEDKRSRVATVYTFNPEKKQLVDATQTFDLSGKGEMVTPIPSGGGGLYSTAGDYARFAQMLLNKGALGEVRLLGKKTVELMFTNQLAHWDDPTHDYSSSAGFGIGGAVQINLSQQDFMGSIGSYGWSGYASTHYLIDPSEDLVMIYLSQHLPMDQHGMYSTIFTMFYQSLVE